MAIVVEKEFNIEQNFDFLDDDDFTREGLTNSNDNSNHSHSPKRVYEQSIFSPEKQFIDSSSHQFNNCQSSFFDQNMGNSGYNFSAPMKNNSYSE